MKILFYKNKFSWPIRHGYGIHAGNLMRSLACRETEVTLLTDQPVQAELTEWLHGVKFENLSAVPARGDIDQSWAGQRFQRFWGVPQESLQKLNHFLKQHQFDCIVAIGPDALVHLDVCKDIKKVWYAADCPSKLHLGLKGSKHKMMALKLAMYETMLKSSTDLTWVVSKEEKKFSKRLGVGRIEVIPNGVDTDYYCGSEDQVSSHTCVFWGNYSFPPNHQAASFLCEEVWPEVRKSIPDAKLHLCGIAPSENLRDLMLKTAGVKFHENLPDIRPVIADSALAVFPFYSGGGVKNKVLEAAAMKKNIVMSERCTSGLQGDPLPMIICKNVYEWPSIIIDQLRIGHPVNSAARHWVEGNHSWNQSGKLALGSLEF